MASYGPHLFVDEDPVDIAAELTLPTGDSLTIFNNNEHKIFFWVSAAEPTPTRDVTFISPGRGKVFTLDGVEKVWLWSYNGGGVNAFDS